MAYQSILYPFFLSQKENENWIFHRDTKLFLLSIQTDTQHQILAIICIPEAAPVDVSHNSTQRSLHLCTLFTQNIFLSKLWNLTLHQIPLHFNQKTCTTEKLTFDLKQKATG